MKFETGKTYTTRSICDYNCIFEYIIIKRTAKTITVNDMGQIKRVGIKIDENGREYAYPSGRYSMAPKIRA